MKRIRRILLCVAPLVGALLLATPSVSAAETSPKVKLAKLRCVRIFRHIVHPLRTDDRVDDDHFRCTVAATNQGDQPATFKMSLRLEQAAEEKGKTPVKLQAEQEIELGTTEASDAEITLDVSQGWNGCMPYKLTVTVGTATLKQRFSPDCPD